MKTSPRKADGAATIEGTRDIHCRAQPFEDSVPGKERGIASLQRRIEVIHIKHSQKSSLLVALLITER